MEAVVSSTDSAAAALPARHLPQPSRLPPPNSQSEQSEPDAQSSNPARERTVPARARNAVRSLGAHIGAHITRKLDMIDERLESLEDGAAAGPVATVMDKAMRASVRKVLKKAGESTRAMLLPPYMPQPLVELIRSLHSEVWPEIASALEASILASNVAKDQKEFELKHWAKTPVWIPPGYTAPPRPLSFLRAKVLYALHPADATKFRHLRDPLALLFIALKMCPYYGINVLVFCLLFLLIDRTVGALPAAPSPPPRTLCGPVGAPAVYGDAQMASARVATRELRRASDGTHVATHKWRCALCDGVVTRSR